MRDDSALDKGTGGTQPYNQPDATQAERRAVLKQRPGEREPTTYHQLAQGEDDLGGRWAEPPAKYPAGPAWTRDLAAQPKEAPLGVNVNWLPDCSGIGGRDPADWPSEFEPRADGEAAVPSASDRSHSDGEAEADDAQA